MSQESRVKNQREQGTDNRKQIIIFHFEFFSPQSPVPNPQSLAPKTALPMADRL